MRVQLWYIDLWYSGARQKEDAGLTCERAEIGSLLMYSECKKPPCYRVTDELEAQLTY